MSDDKLRLFFERLERLEEDKNELFDDIWDVCFQAKLDGYDIKIMKQIAALRKMSRDDRHKMEAVLELYKHAVGLD
jgi:uncharacterized protein (UPF0335 family)